jgi:hypothetical protein
VGILFIPLQMHSALGLGQFVDGVDHIQIHGFAGATGFLGAVQHGDGFHRFGQGIHEGDVVEGPIEAHLQHADLFALGVKGIHRFMGGFTAGPHQNHHSLRIWRTMVFEDVVLASGQLRKLIHGLLHDVGTGVVVAVDGLPPLEVHIRVLGGAANHRTVGG